ncbi:molybdenum cofactor biosynthesis protein MoaE [Methylomicrobium sp. Wu6]|uniref:molybdenum cofactor biosynthesis protein MoaE n=1 Tax=Methylomicrobium sp. Wu6 TaxID=3107928 RepID=UPI002DD6AC08|nr:molybdenum cofactor biosynthesis protein MoaE [Methylomicrobium sp. Wu6]MEC4750141.1 molybdenum cofactor biosynthesis protein MoaE [Methylomicrobium sp. Wu6]
MLIKISAESFDPWSEVRDYQDESGQMAGKFGATSLFVGTMRDFNEGDDVAGMILEHYPGMTERALEKIVREAVERWPVIDTLVVHRVGEIGPGEPIVLVAVWTSHRGDAFDASRYIMEALKSKAPFWKKEVLKGRGERWVAHNTDGYLKTE